MKKMTMIMRIGDPKDKPENLVYTFITEDYKFERMNGGSVVNSIKAKQIEVTNLGIGETGLVSTNGALKNYTLIDKETGTMIVGPKAVILNRVESDKGLIGYTILNTSGTLQEINVAQAAELAKEGLISNGKIRHTQQGDIVASINGYYPLRKIKISDEIAKPNETVGERSITTELLFCGSAIAGSKKVEYAGLIINSKSAITMTKLFNTLSKANKDLMKRIKDIAKTTEEEKALALKVTGSAGFYGVYPIDVVFELIKRSDNKVAFPMGNLVIACTDYENNKEEANITITPDMKKTNYQESTTELNNAVSEYTDKIIFKFRDIKIK